MDDKYIKSYVNISSIKFHIEYFSKDIEETLKLESEFNHFCTEIFRYEEYNGKKRILSEIIISKSGKSVESLFSLLDKIDIDAIIDYAKKDKLLKDFYEKIKNKSDNLEEFKKIVINEKKEAFVLKYQYSFIKRFINSNSKRKEIISNYINHKKFKEFNKETKLYILNLLTHRLKILLFLNQNHMQKFSRKDRFKVYLYLLLAKEELNSHLLYEKKKLIDNTQIDIIKEDKFEIEKFKIISDILKITNDELIVKFQETDILIDFFEKVKYYPFTGELDPPLSSGQKAILFIFARIDYAIKQIKSKNITILLDEADLKLHLEWQRQFINDLVEFLKSYSDKNFYVLYATHSPMILSDITDDRIVFLKKEGDYSIDKPINETKSTFGANIYDLYHDSFFMDRYMGEFAFNKINDVINMVNLYKIVMELNGDEKQERLKDYERIYNFDKLFQSYALYYPEAKIDSENLYEKQEEIKSNIESQKEHLKATAKFIGEPLLRNKLEDDLNSIGREFDIDKVVEKLQGLSQQEIKEELSKYSESIQMKILKKLFASEHNHDKS
jgi:hypothetical protein